MSVLDDLKIIHSRDPEDALGVVEKQWQQLNHVFDAKFEPKQQVKNVVLCGMGGSAWPALYVASWPGLLVPFEISRDYHVPKYVDENTLVIASSYSGNTEETLSALADAESKNAQIVVMTAGGKLAQLAREKNLPLFEIPGGIQPRMSSFFFIKAMLQIFETAKVIDQYDKSQLTKISDWLKSEVNTWRPDTPTKDNPAKQLALEIVGKTAIIYSGPGLAPVANKLKICLNENAKNLAWWNQYPEFNHNEFIGWSSHPVDKPFAVVEIRSSLDHPRIKKRFEISAKLLSGKRPSPNIIEPKGETLPEQIFWCSVFGDFVATYVAVLNNVDPTPVALVEKLKVELG